MDERKEVLIVCLILLAIGAVAFYLTTFYGDFNFYKSKINLNDNIIEETLYYKTNKPYHTLYRNFKTPVTIENLSAYSSSPDGYIIINSVSCSNGKPYVNTGVCHVFPEKIKQNCPYTEPNEYGCTFGNTYGFIKGQEYLISSSYILEPKTVFKIKGDYYIKFVAYSKNNHKFLTTGSSLMADNAITKKFYFPNEDVILYIPYTLSEVSSFSIIEKNDFDLGYSNIIFPILFFLSPTIIFFLLWYFFGKENLISEHPPELSFYPRERKGWQVAAFFNHPFSKIDKNFFSATLLDFYRRKIIDTKMKEKEVLIKLNHGKKSSLDEVEKQFFSILEIVEQKCKDKYREGEYFNLKKASSQFFMKSSLQPAGRVLEKAVSKEGKNYLNKNALFILPIFLVIIYIFSNVLRFFLPLESFIFIIASFIVILIASNTSSLLIKFKGEYYKEYEHWQSYKRFLKYSSLSLHSHKGVVMWEQHLVYAAALGVAKKVLKELKAAHLINEKEYNFYMGTYLMSSSFARSSGTTSSGSGGVGGGGIGGGGGGGR